MHENEICWAFDYSKIEERRKKWATFIRIRVVLSCRRLDVPNIFNAFYIICDLARKQNFALICTLKKANKFSKYIYKNVNIFSNKNIEKIKINYKKYSVGS